VTYEHIMKTNVLTSKYYVFREPFQSVDYLHS